MAAHGKVFKERGEKQMVGYRGKPGQAYAGRCLRGGGGGGGGLENASGHERMTRNT